MSFEPLDDRVLLRPIKKNETETTASGIIIPDVVKKQVCEAEVIAVGIGVYARDSGQLIPTYVNKGNLVLVGADNGNPAGLEIEVDGEVGYVVREGDILGITKKKA